MVCCLEGHLSPLGQMSQFLGGRRVVRPVSQDRATAHWPAEAASELSTRPCVPDVPVEWKALCHVPENPGTPALAEDTESFSLTPRAFVSFYNWVPIGPAMEWEHLVVSAGTSPRLWLRGWRLPWPEPPGLCGNPAYLGAFLNVGVKHLLLFPF